MAKADVDAEGGRVAVMGSVACGNGDGGGAVGEGMGDGGCEGGVVGDGGCEAFPRQEASSMVQQTTRKTRGRFISFIA